MGIVEAAAWNSTGIPTRRSGNICQGFGMPDVGSAGTAGNSPQSGQPASAAEWVLPLASGRSTCCNGFSCLSGLFPCLRESVLRNHPHKSPFPLLTGESFMTQRFASAAALLAASMVFVSFAAERAAAADDQPELKCPVSGQKAKSDQKTKFMEGEVCFCCGKCRAAFEKDSSKFANKARAQLVASGQYEQKKCPFSGGPMKTSSKIAGVTVKFCCNNCKKKADAAEGDDQVALVFGEAAFKKGFAKKKD